MLQDLRHALRALAARPGFTLLGALTLALGIGATAAVFSLLDALYFRPLPLRDAGGLVRITRPSTKSVFGMLSHAEYLEMRAALPAVSELVAVGPRGITLHRGGESRLLRVNYVSPNFFDALGIAVPRGRGFRPGDEASATPLVVLNDHVWRERLGGAGDVVGSQVRLNDALFTVVGVTAPRFLGLDRTLRTDAWVLTDHARFAVPALAGEVADRSARWFQVYGRLADAASAPQARAQAESLSRRWAAEDARTYAGAGLAVAPLAGEARAAARQGAIVLGLASLVLLIACANAANLTLARSEARRREMAVRVALGASRGRLVRQLALESLLLGAAGAAAGLLLARALMTLFPALVPPGAVTYTLDVRFDARLLAFVAVLLAVTTALVAAVPAWRSGRGDVVHDLKPAAVGGSAERRWSARDIIVIAQTGVSVFVLVAAGLLVRSLHYGARLDAGFDAARNVATFYVVPALRGYDRAAAARFFEEARRGAAALPGVRGASYAIRLPSQGNEAGWAADFFIPGKEPPPGDDAFRIRYGIVGPDYFEVLGAPIVHGRGVRESDGPDAQPVAVINETMAERLWPGEDPIGKHVVMGRKTRVAREIVGVARNAKIADLYEPAEMYVYVPFAQDPQGFALLLVETTGAAGTAWGPVKAMLAALDPGLPVLDTGSLDRHRALLLFDERRDAWVGGAVGLLGLALGAVGVYGVVSLVAARRTREIGVRIALGARRRDVVGLVLGRGVRLAAAGCAGGVAMGLASTRLLAGRLHGVAPTDPAAFLFGVGCLLTAAVVASALPALRAARIDPMAAIREE